MPEWIVSLAIPVGAAFCFIRFAQAGWLYKEAGNNVYGCKYLPVFAVRFLAALEYADCGRTGNGQFADYVPKRCADGGISTDHVFGDGEVRLAGNY